VNQTLIESATKLHAYNTKINKSTMIQSSDTEITLSSENKMTR